MTSKTNPLIEFLRGRLSWRDLPEEITLPRRLWHQMDELWRRSIAHIAEGRVSEWDGVLVLDEQDNLKLVNIVEGTAFYMRIRRPRCGLLCQRRPLRDVQPAFLRWHCVRNAGGGAPTVSEYLIKDDTELMQGITRRIKERRAKGLPERDESSSDKVALAVEWRRMQQARSAPWTYYVVIEYKNGAYQAHALSFPEVTAQGETVEAVKEAMVQALQAHFAALRATGEPVPTRDYKRVDTVEVSFEEVQEALQTSSGTEGTDEAWFPQFP